MTQGDKHLTEMRERERLFHLLVVLELLQGEDVFVEVLLQLLVGVVDVELLKTVHLGGKEERRFI